MPCNCRTMWKQARCGSNTAAPGRYDLHVRYFDEEDGVSKFKLFVAGRLLDRWQADNHLPTPTTLPNSHSSIRRTVHGVMLKPGDEIRFRAPRMQANGPLSTTSKSFAAAIVQPPSDRQDIASFAIATLFYVLRQRGFFDRCLN